VSSRGHRAIALRDHVSQASMAKVREVQSSPKPLSNRPTEAQHMREYREDKDDRDHDGGAGSGVPRRVIEATK